MFYASTFSPGLRLGDIVSGYATAIPDQSEPIRANFIDYSVDIKVPSLLVVLTPCCSIKGKTIAVVPLLTILEAERKKFFINPNFREDMTLINLPHTIEEWEYLGHKVTEDEQEGREKYTLESLFIYAEDPRLPEYDVIIRGETFKSSYHVIDFRNASKVNCDCIIHEEDKNKYPNYDDLLEKVNSTKKLELDPKARETLRRKLAFYYRRIPKEDKPALG